MQFFAKWRLIALAWTLSEIGDLGSKVMVSVMQNTFSSFKKLHLILGLYQKLYRLSIS